MTRYRLYLLTFLSGVCATLTLPPFYIFPLVVPAYGGLYALLTHATTKKSSAVIGFFWGWGFYMSGLYWFCIALLTDPEKFAWLIPFALFALTAVIALYTTLFAWLFFLVKQKISATKYRAIIATFSFATLWTIIEYARGHLFTGFPWNLGGYAFAASNSSIQLASIVGIYGLTFITIWLGVITMAHRKAALLSWSLLIIALIWGYNRTTYAPLEFVDGVKLRLVQANIAQHHKWDPKKQMEGLQAHIKLTQAPGLEHITHVIWPETAVPYALSENSTLATHLGLAILPNQHLITGALRLENDRVYNSANMIDQSGNIVGEYHKHKLVPFGEFLPLRWAIPDALETPVGMQDISSGSGTKTLSWPGLPPVSPLICYEVIFPELAALDNPRPAWLLSITNDAWFGTSTAPYQHLAMARMRAVEQGLPMVRVANTGISAVFDAYGRELARINLNESGWADTSLPAPATSTTWFTMLF